MLNYLFFSYSKMLRPHRFIERKIKRQVKVELQKKDYFHSKAASSPLPNADFDFIDLYNPNELVVIQNTARTKEKIRVLKGKDHFTVVRTFHDCPKNGGLYTSFAAKKRCASSSQFSYQRFIAKSELARPDYLNPPNPVFIWKSEQLKEVNVIVDNITRKRTHFANDCLEPFCVEFGQQSLHFISRHSGYIFSIIDLNLELIKPADIVLREDTPSAWLQVLGIYEDRDHSQNDAVCWLLRDTPTICFAVFRPIHNFKPMQFDLSSPAVHAEAGTDFYLMKHGQELLVIAGKTLDKRSQLVSFSSNPSLKVFHQRHFMVNSSIVLPSHECFSKIDIAPVRPDFSLILLLQHQKLSIAFFHLVKLKGGFVGIQITANKEGFSSFRGMVQLNANCFLLYGGQSCNMYRINIDGL